MKNKLLKNNQSNQSDYQEQLNDDYSTLEHSSQKNNKFLPQNIHLTKQSFQTFIEQLGQLKFTPLQLDPYKADFAEAKLERNINLSEIHMIFQNTIRKMTANKRQKKNWSRDDFIIMLWVIQKYNALHHIQPEQYQDEDWTKISTFVPGKDHHQCMFKWLGLKKNKNTDKYPWTETEDILLKKIVNESNPNRWFQVSKELYLQNKGSFKCYRSPKQCRQRWACYLNPKLKKGPWSPQEDMILLGKYLQIGKKWSNISKLLNGRTENAVKNRFNLILQKKQKLRSKVSDQDFIRNHLQNIEVNLFMKTCDSTPKTLTLSDFSSQLDQDQFILQSPKQQPQNFEKILENYTSLTDNDHLSETGQEQKNTKFITFKRLSFSDLMSLTENIFPAEYDEEKVEINYKSIKPTIKVNKDLSSFKTTEYPAPNLMELEYDPMDFSLNENYLKEQFLF